MINSINEFLLFLKIRRKNWFLTFFLIFVLFDRVIVLSQGLVTSSLIYKFF